MSQQELFAAAVDKLVREARQLPEESALRVLNMLEEVRREIVGRIAAAPSSFGQAQLHALVQAIDRALATFSDKATTILQNGQEDQFRFGRVMVDTPLETVGVTPMLIGLSEHNLAIAQGYSARLISGLSHEMQVQLDGALRRAMLGGQQLTDIIGQVGKAVTGEAQAPSIFSKGGSRALRIVRTEIPRMLSLGTQARLNDYAERLGADRVLKGWKHNPQLHPRVRHIEMDGVEIPVKDKFQVPGSAEQLMYPRDPEGSAAETVNCGCTLVPVVKRLAA